MAVVSDSKSGEGDDEEEIRAVGMLCLVEASWSNGGSAQPCSAGGREGARGIYALVVSSSWLLLMACLYVS